MKTSSYLFSTWTYTMKTDGDHKYPTVALSTTYYDGVKNRTRVKSVMERPPMCLLRAKIPK